MRRVRPKSRWGRRMPQPYSGDLRERVVAAAASQTQAEVAARFAVGESTVYKWCRRARESGSAAVAERAREDVAAARDAWAEARAAVPPEDWVFVDESGVATDMVRRYGRAPGGQRARGTAPYGRWERLTIFGGLSRLGLVACMSITGAADTPAVLAFLEHALVPVLRPGRVVVLDNLAPHKAARVRALIERAGCRLLFLPPYSPDFNPIEPAWSKLKTLLRGMGARTTAALDAALTALVDAITASDARGFFRHCGYAVQ
jgi:transposase/transposase-like protein